MNQPNVTIIIPTYHDWHRLKLCLGALQKQTYKQQDFEIIVVNNDALDKVPDDFVLPENARLLTEAAPGSYAARNAGLAAANGDIVGFTDSDCIPDLDWISNAIANFDADAQADRVTGPVNLFRLAGSSWLAYQLDRASGFRQFENVNNGVSVTANLFVRKRLFNDVGLFNADLMSGGDFEWNTRATNMGYSIKFNEKVAIKHPARAKLSDVVRTFRRVVAGGFAKSIIRKNCILFVLRLLVPPLKTGSYLIKNKEPFWLVIMVVFLLWVIKLSMIIEIIRVSLGGKPLR